MRGELPYLLVSVHLHGLWAVEGGDDLIGVHRDQDRPSVCLETECLLFECGILRTAHIDLVPIISDQKIPQYPGLVEVAKAYHVLHSSDGGRVHGLDPPLWRQPLLLAIVINDLYPAPFGPRDHSGPESNVKLTPGHRLYPDVISLQKTL